MSESKREYSEKDITEKIMQYFFDSAENKEKLSKSKNNISFDFLINGIKFRCQTEKGLSYTLPNEKFQTHNADIVITRNEKMTDSYVLNPSNRFVSIEVKHKSAVTDAFKARAYDMIHLKKEHALCLGIMMYIREGNITIEKAKEYCYPYQKFFGCTTEELVQEKIKPLFDEIVSYLKEEIKNNQRSKL